MSAPSVDFPLVLEPVELEPLLGASDLRVVDLCARERYAQGHVPGAVHLAYAALVRQQPPAMGLLPEVATLGRVLGELGIGQDTHVVAYDDEGSGRAARLLWTLAALGHTRHSLLNGGLHAWAGEGHALELEPATPAMQTFEAHYNPQVVAERAYVEACLGAPQVRLLDCRSPGEYRGLERRAERAGHIPGAVNLEWTEAIDRTRNLRLQPRAALMPRLEALGITPDHEVIAYCQTHHRSAHTWAVLKALGFEHVRGYPGSWSEWGNLPDTPVET